MVSFFYSRHFESLMKLPARLLILSACLLGRAAFAAIVVPGANGTDGALTITEDTVIDLSQAPTGTWDQDNTANAGKGVYDPEKWAVVFKYTDVTIASGKKVTFKNHATRAPVVWLVSGNVSIAGTVDLSGESVTSYNFDPILLKGGGSPSEPGPGGFRGGSGWQGGNSLNSAGFGPGGGRIRTTYYTKGYGSAGGYGTSSNTPWSTPAGQAYGNPSLIPLIGGSGGVGNREENSTGSSGGAGGGAILVACQNSISFSSGKIVADGGRAWQYAGPRNAAGSGGGIRLVCDSLIGGGALSAVGGSGSDGAILPGNGRVRLERVLNTNTISVVPSPSVLDLAASSTAVLWAPAGSPKAKVLSVNAASAPSDPKASFGTYAPDVALPLGSTADVIVETENVEAASQVIVRITPRNGMAVETQITNDATEVTAVLDTTFTPPSPGILRWKATVPTLPGHSAVQARIIRP